MNRLDKAIADVAFILDALMAYRNVLQTGNCNECESRKVCRVIPKPGQMVRYNCPYFVRMDAEPGEDGEE